MRDESIETKNDEAFVCLPGYSPFLDPIGSWNDGLYMALHGHTHESGEDGAAAVVEYQLGPIGLQRRLQLLTGEAQLK